MLIPRDGVQMDKRSFFDDSGRLFWWKEGLYRGIAPEDAEFFRSLFGESPLEGVVNTTVTDLELPPFGLVLQHQVLPFVTYPYEWSPTMLKDAALHVIRLQIELSKRSLTLKDAHGWNVLFQGPIPVQVDVGSIAPHPGGTWQAAEEFRRFFLNPLRLYARNCNRVARTLLMDFDLGVTEADVHRLGITTLANRALRKSRAVAERRATTSGKADPRIKELVNLQKRVEAARVAPPKGEWSDYYDETFPSFQPTSGQWTEKHRGVHSILSRLRPERVFDIGSNTGWFAELAADLGSHVIAGDPDEAAVDALYLRTKSTGKSIVPIVFDIRRPTPAQGMGYSWFTAATSRFNSDMVTALGLVHHLVFKANLKLDVIAEELCSYSSRWLIVEFIPPDDQFVRERAPEKKPWYSLEGFMDALGRHMTHVETLPSAPSPRVLLLYERK